MHRGYPARRLERQFEPDLLITMSGPGSFAACTLMRLNVRDVPVLVATTFPGMGEPNRAERAFATAAVKSGAVHLRTAKWSIYLPSLVRHLPAQHRVALVDDRVVTGESQLLTRKLLIGMGYQVACAALFANPGAPVPDLMVGREIPALFQLPWGSARGRA